MSLEQEVEILADRRVSKNKFPDQHLLKKEKQKKQMQMDRRYSDCEI